MKSKKEIFDILEPGGRESLFFDSFIVTLIVLNVFVIILSSVESLNKPFGLYFYVFEVFSVVVFSIEYVLRAWTCDIKPEYQGLRGHFRYLTTPMAIVDFLAIAPFYMVFLPNLMFLRILRIFRIFRVLKLARYNDKMIMFGKILQSKKEELALSTFIVLVVMTISASLMYELEHEAQPKAFEDIPHAMWWGIVTLATIGYGDIYPITPMGKFVGGIIILMGIALFALPAGILAAGFSEAHMEEPEKKKVCPHCGRNL